MTSVRGGQRLNTSTTGNAEASVELEITIQNISFPRSQPITKPSQSKLFVETMLQFFQLIKSNHSNATTDTKQYITAAYAGHQVVLHARGGTLILGFRCPSAKLVSLQCDHSSGQLTEEIQHCLVTKTALHELGIDAMTINTEVKNQ